ncbi:MAG: efflux RND transporter periplasmic adaptor subunit [Verrucomicrobiota bacterium]
MDRTTTYAGLALALACLFALLSGCDRKPPPEPKEPTRSVTEATVMTKDVPLYYDTLGRATSLEDVDIVSQVDGQIMEVHFTQGSMVKKGDLLYTIFQPPFQAAVTEATGKLQQSIAALEIAILEVERNRPLVPQKLVSEQDFQQLEANVIELEGQVEEDTGALERAQVNLEYCSIHAPVDGMIGVYQVNVGNVVTAAESMTLTTIQQMDPIYVDFIVPTTEFPAVLKHFRASGNKLTAVVSYLDGAGPKRNAAVTILGNQVAENTGTINLRATMENKDGAFWPNQPLSVRILLEELKGALVVPQGAVAIGQQGHFSFIINDDNTVKQVGITVGQRQTGGLMVVQSGLTEGQRVVVDGQVFLMSGESVIPTNVGSKKDIKLPKSMTSKVVDLVKKYNPSATKLINEIQTTNQLPVELLEKMKAHGAMSARDVAFIEEIEGYGDAGKGTAPATSDSSSSK